MIFIKEEVNDFSNISMEIKAFEGVIPSLSKVVEVDKDTITNKVQFNDCEWKVSCKITPSTVSKGTYFGEATFSMTSGKMNNANVSINMKVQDWSTENYVLMPGAVYNGNRFRVVNKNYPPMLHEEDGIGVNMPITITDVPHLNINNGPSHIHLRSGDMSTPCLGIHSPKDNKGVIILFDHDTPFGYTGLKFFESEGRKSAEISIEVPAVREEMYTMCSTCESDDIGYNFKAGDQITIHFNLYTFEAKDVSEVFKKYFEVRKDLSGEVKLLNNIPFSKAYRIIEDKYKKYNWNSERQYLKVGVSKDDKFGDWQAGWVGGGMNSLSFLTDGDKQTREYAYKTMDAIFTKLQAKSGFIYPIMFKDNFLGDDFYHQEKINILLLRKDADVLLFASRHILLLQKRWETVPSIWVEGIRKLADAFVRLWDKYGQLGQFIDLEKEEILQGGTASAAISPAGLALAYKILGNSKYLDTAISAGNYYYKNYVYKGILNGGPGEILQNIDSESAFGMLESFVTLYETTQDLIYLSYAKECAYQCASWCVSYDFDFPDDSTFRKLDMKTTGSVFANAQNKHSAPGICTLSGLSILKLYRATKDKGFLQLIKEISHNITQYVSREDRLIFAKSNDEYLPSGFVCERVNMSDWEGKNNIGEVFYGSCWCEISCLLTYNEIPGVWILSDIGEVIVFDHVEATVKDLGESWEIKIKNPTKYDADVKVLAEPYSQLDKIWGESVLENSKLVHLSPGEETTLTIIKDISYF